MAVLRSLTTTLGLNSAQFREELKRSQKQYQTFGSAVASGTKATAKAIGGMTSAVVSLKTAVIAIGTGAALYGIKQAYENADEIRRQADMIGLSAGQWSAYEKAVRQVGGTSEELADIIKDLNVKITDAAKTDGGALVDFFAQIGESAATWAAMSPDEQFRRFTDEINQMTDTDARFWLDEVNGSAVNLFDTLVKNDGELFRLADQARELGLALNDTQFDQIKDTRRELEALAVTGSAMWQQVVAAAAPAVDAISRGIRQWVIDQAQAAGGFQNLGVLITETVLTAVLEVSRVLEDTLNTLYLGAEDVAGMMGKTLNPQRASLNGQLDDAIKKAANLYDELEQVTYISGHDAPQIINTGSDEQWDAYRQAQERVEALRAEIEQPFSFSGDVESQVEGIVAKIRQAQANIASNPPPTLAPPSVSGVVGVDDAVKKQQEASAKILASLKSQLDSEERQIADSYQLRKEQINALVLSQEQITASGFESEKALRDYYHKLNLQDKQNLLSDLDQQEIEAAGKKREKLQAELEEIQQNYANKEQLLLESTQREQEIIQQSVDNRLISEQEGHELSQESWNAYFDELGESNLGFWEQMLEHIESTTEDFDAMWGNAFENFTSGVGDAFADAIVEGDNFHDAMDQISKGFAKSMVSALVQIGAQRTALWMLEKAQHAESVGLMIVRTIAETGATVAKAGLNAYNAIVGIPYVGPILAPPAAAAAIGIAGSYASEAVSKLSGMAHDGIDSIPREGTWLLDKGERVVDSRTNADLKNYLSNPGSEQVQSITLAPQIVVESGASQSGDEFLAENVAAQVFNMVLSDAKTGGVLSRALGGR